MEINVLLYLPLDQAMAERCRGVDLLSGDLNQELLPLCGVHQICYLCVSDFLQERLFI